MIRLFIFFTLIVSTALAEDAFVEEARPVIDRYCLDCHDSITQKGGLNLEMMEFERDLYTHHV